MAENTTNDEDLKNKNPELDQPSDENIPFIQPDIESLIQETDNMETHAHHLHHAPGKRKWHYFYEFLMLFLAVFCGFLAENIRENIIEHNRSKEFAISLVKDLQNDTTSINSFRKTSTTYIATADSLLNLSKQSLVNRNAAKFYFYTRFMYWTVPHSWNRASSPRQCTSLKSMSATGS